MTGFRLFAALINYLVSLVTGNNLPPRHCMYCNTTLAMDLDSQLTHCKTCPAMPRIDPFRHKFMCYACDYFSYNSGSMRSHINTHTGEKPFACEQCNFRSASLAGIHYHKKKNGHQLQFPLQLGVQQRLSILVQSKTVRRVMSHSIQN